MNFRNNAEISINSDKILSFTLGQNNEKGKVNDLEFMIVEV